MPPKKLIVEPLQHRGFADFAMADNGGGDGDLFLNVANPGIKEGQFFLAIGEKLLFADALFNGNSMAFALVNWSYDCMVVFKYRQRK